MRLLTHRATRRAALVVFLFAWSLTTHGKYSASGDEPHYLMIAHSIVVDRDMDVANNYADNDGRFFGHANLEMGLHAVPARNGHVRPIHDVGLAVAIVPVYAVALQIARLPPEALLARVRMDRGLFAYSIVSLSLIALTAFGLMLLAQGLHAFVPPATAALVVIAAGISPPIVSHSFLVFPEAMALFVSCAVAWVCFRPDGAHHRQDFIGVLLAVGLLPWMHHKYLLYSAGLLFVVLWKRWGTFRTMTRGEQFAALALFAVPQVALLAWTWNEWGTFGGALTTGGLPFSAEMAKSGLPGLVFDRRSGLLAYAPIYWIAPACLYLTRRDIWPLLVPAALLYLPAAAFTIGWWAGFSPAARYIVPLVPFLVVSIAGAMRYRAIRIAALVLMVPQLLIDAVVWQHPRALWPSAADNAALQAFGAVGRAYEAVLPDAQGGAPLPVSLVLAVFALAGSAALVVLAQRRLPVAKR